MHAIRTFIRTFCPDGPHLPIRRTVKGHQVYPDIYPDTLSGNYHHFLKP